MCERGVYQLSEAALQAILQLSDLKQQSLAHDSVG